MLAGGLLCACEKSETSNDDAGSQSTLLIEVNTQTLSIDNSEVVTFTVLLDGKDVTPGSQIINITDGGYSALSKPEFTTYRPGVHTFFAIYNEQNSDTVAVQAISESNLSSTYYRRNLIMKFTATSCTYCPAMGTTIESAMKLYPDRLIEVAAHSDEYLATSTSLAYNGQFGITSLPSVVVDMNSSYLITTRVASLIIDKSKLSLEENPTVVGLKCDTAYDSQTSNLTVDVESTIVADGNYKILVLLLQSGYNYDQSGTDDPDYTQDHVIFTALTADKGDSLGDLRVGEKVIKSYEFNYMDTAGFTVDTTQAEVVVCILNEVGTATYAVNNAISLGFDESVDYQYEPVIE